MGNTQSRKKMKEEELRKSMKGTKTENLLMMMCDWLQGHQVGWLVNMDRKEL